MSKKARIDKGIIIYSIDIVMGIAFLITFVTGILKFPGLYKLLGTSAPNFNWRILSRLHDWAGLIMGILVLIHIIMHWGWLATMTKKIFTKKTK